MNSRSQNHLHMAGSAIRLAQSKEYRPVWDGQPPADFGTDLAKAAADHAAIAASPVVAASEGVTEAKAAAETALESAAFVLARAVSNHAKKAGDRERLAKVDYTRSEIERLRDQDLVSTSATILVEAQAAAEPKAANRGVTAARIAALETALGTYRGLVNAPRSTIAGRGAQLKDQETAVAALVAHLRDMNDLVEQFDATELGRRFIAAWKRALTVVDAGGGHAAREGDAPAPPAPPKV